MHKCSKCGTEYEGNFCPECGAKREEAKTCLKCGKALAGDVKFCPDCGYSFVSAPPASPKPAPTASPVTERTKKLYAFVSVFPAALFALLSVVFMLLFLAPVAVMPGGELLGQTIPSESYGNVYDISNFDGSSLTGSLTTLIVFAACALVLAALIVFTTLFIKARYKRVTIFGKRIFLRNVFAGIGYVLFFLLFLISCILLGQISNEDGGFGIFTAGAAPILTLVFSLIGCIAAVICALVARHLRSTYPALVKEQEEKIAAAQPTGFETWLKKHKKAAVVVSMILVVAVIVGVAVPVAIANRHNGVYYVYNGETEEYNMERYYKLSGGTWQDEDGNKGEIIFDGENVTLTYDASGGMDKTGMSKIEMEGTIQKDVLKIGGTIYAKGGHKHEFDEWKTEKEATCIEKGLEKQVCICGKTEERETALVDHAWEKVDIAATCAEAGYEGNRCPVCGKEEGTYKEALHIRYELSSDERSYTVTGLSSQCPHSDIVIPETYKGLPVTSIEDYAFWGCSGLTSITIPDSVTSIEDHAFGRCSGLTSITIPDSVTEIGACAFASCYGLTSVTIGSGVTSIGNNAFDGCNRLTSVRIGSGVTSIGSQAFDLCNELEHIIVDEGNKVYRSEQDCLIEIETKTLVLGCKKSIIPDSVTSIGYSAFSDCYGLTSITIPDSVTSIGRSAFSDCYGLTSITIPDSVTSIEEDAFYDCDGLTDIRFKGTVEEWQAIDKEMDWNLHTGNYTITCTDGTIDKEGNVTYFEQ